MANQWFRLYSEFADDPKVQSMPEHMQRRLIMLFCSRCKEEKIPESLRAFHWRISPAELAETKSVFMENGFIDDMWNLLNWNKRQFLSDSSADRTRRYRDRLKRHSDGDVTKCDVIEQNRTDTEQKKQSPRGSRIPESFSVTEEHRTFARMNKLPSPDSQIGAFKDYWEAKSGKDAAKLDWDKTFHNWLRNANGFNHARPVNTPGPDRYKLVGL